MVNFNSILAMPVNFPEALFVRQEAVQEVFRRLSKVCHPDAGGNQETFEHLVALREAATTRIREGQWVGDGKSLILRRQFEKGDVVIPQPMRMWESGLGRAYLAADAGQALVACRYHRAKVSFAAAGVEKVRKLLASPPAAKKTVLAKTAHMLPVLKSSDLLLDGDGLWQWRSALPGGFPIRLADAIAYSQGSVPARHAAWIISRLLDFCCLMEYLGWVHCGLHPENVYIEPQRHDLAVLGGWEYSVRAGDRLATLQDPRTVAAMTSTMQTGKMAAGTLDLALVKRIAWQLAGEPAGLPTETAIKHWPGPVARWILGVGAAASLGSARESLEAWQAALEAGFGAREFSVFPFAASDVYLMQP